MPGGNACKLRLLPVGEIFLKKIGYLCLFFYAGGLLFLDFGFLFYAAISRRETDTQGRITAPDPTLTQHCKLPGTAFFLFLFLYAGIYSFLPRYGDLIIVGFFPRAF